MPGGAAHRQEVESIVEATGPAGVRCAERKIARGDRRREAVVERVRDPQPRVEPVPAEPARVVKVGDAAWDCVEIRNTQAKSVTQICNLLYRRIAFCNAFAISET